MRQEERRRRILHLRQEAVRVRAEAVRGFTDRIYDGRLIATADEIAASAWRIVADCESQANKLAKGLRGRK